MIESRNEHIIFTGITVVQLQLAAVFEAYNPSLLAIFIRRLVNAEVLSAFNPGLVSNSTMQRTIEPSSIRFLVQKWRYKHLILLIQHLHFALLAFAYLKTQESSPSVSVKRLFDMFQRNCTQQHCFLPNIQRIRTSRWKELKTSKMSVVTGHDSSSS